MRLLIIIALILAITACGKKELRNEIPENEQPAELLKYGEQFYQEGDYENAFRAYGIIYYNFPTSREYIDAAIGLSKCYGALRNYEKQFEILYTLLRENLIPSKIPQVYNAIGEFYERSAGISEQLTGAGNEDYRTAIKYYNKAINYPNSEEQAAKSFAQYKIGTLYEKLDENSKAIEAYETALNSYQGTEWALRSEQNILDIQERMRRRAEYEESGMLPSEPASSQEPEVPIETTAPGADTTSTAPLVTEPAAATDQPDTSRQEPAQVPPAAQPSDTLSLPADTSVVDTSIRPKLDFK